MVANTTYKVELSLTDPDGGSETRTGIVTTRAVPTPMAGAPVKNATPTTLASVLNGAQPGDIIELGAGGVYDGYDNGRGKVTDLSYADATHSFNYEAYGSTTATFTGRIGGVSFSSLAQMRATTTETTAIQIDLNVFNAAVAYPGSPLAAELPPPAPRLRAGRAAVNAGQAIPNINDGYAGAAPDVGAFELGAAVPAYGPRPAASPPQVTAVQVHDGSIQRSMVTSLTVTFSTQVTLGSGAFTLTPQGGGTAVPLSVTTAVVGGVTVATLTFPGGTGGSLADGNWVLRTVAAAVRDSSGTAMTTDRTDALYRLYGDANGDRAVNAADLNLFRSVLGATTTDVTFDFNEDGVINTADLNFFRTNLGSVLNP